MFVHHQNVRYHENAAALFAQLSGLDKELPVLLLESSDVESKKNTKCMAVLRAAMVVTCQGQTVLTRSLTEIGDRLSERLQGQLGDYLHAVREGERVELEFHFQPSSEHDERKRLKDVSNAEVLRALQLDAGYEGQSLPFIAGGFAFDYLETFEELPAVGEGPNTFPDYQFLVAQDCLRIDHLDQTAVLEVLDIDEATTAARLESLSQQIADFQAPSSQPQEVTGTLEVVAQTTDADFRAQVERLQENIYQGDIYQVVPARAFQAPCPDAFAAYLQLREINPSPYMFYMHSHHHGRAFELFGASPESNLKFESADRLVQVYPVAGTRPRGLHADGSLNHELDIRAELDMRTDAKEVAEHIMLVDLVRNDLARIARPATRKVAELLQVDRYSRVMHLVSRVVATLDDDFDALDAYRACMNMGTLSGAPKLRATSLLREVEGVRRGSYGGAVGYLAGDGSMDTCIVIRSGFVQDGRITVHAGAGVVRDSVPQSESDETLHKAFPVLQAVALAQHAQLKVVK